MKMTLVLAGSTLAMMTMILAGQATAADVTVSTGASAAAAPRANTSTNTSVTPRAAPSTTPRVSTGASASRHVYAVTKVAPDDGLNMRSQPGVGGTVVIVLPSNAKGVLALGEERKSGNSTWIKISWAGKQGWVNKYYLSEDVQTSAQPVNSSVVMECGGTEPFWSMHISEKQMDVTMLDGPKYVIPVEFRQQSANNTTVAVVAGSRGNAHTTAFLQKVETCSDGMSDKNYPYSVTAVLNSQKVVSGCCSITGGNN